ncbi:MAG: LytTR family DNA-binding domain-containing protein [Salinivirgaceae bacterium]|jgi:two-component system LytT family response regulator|nr:LytTR family DNA-binding domain-containing protein [Salinivirgaceae bacterium]
MKKHPLSCIIVDDDPFSRETLEDLLGEITQLQILKSLSESGMAIKYLATLKPDIAFLDINMPTKDGLNVLTEINDLGILTKVVFVTSHEDYLMDALKMNAFDYLIKPVKKQELQDAIDRYLKTVEALPQIMQKKSPTQNSHKIVIQNAHGTLLLQPKQIAYIEADGCYTNLHFINQKTEVVSKNLGRIETLFPTEQFFKISRSVIINTNYLNRIDRLRKTIHLQYNESNVALKASRNQLYDLEGFIHKH